MFGDQVLNSLMKEYRIKVVCEQKEEGADVLSDGRFIVYVKAKRDRGEANQRAREILAGILGCTVDDIFIVRGHTQSTKTIRVRD